MNNQNGKDLRNALLKRLRFKPTREPDYVYHVTRGVHLASIKQHGLIAQDKSEQQYASKKNWFSPNLNQAYKLYGANIIRHRYRFSSVIRGRRFARIYFQGIAVLRCKPAFLISQKYVQELHSSLAGEQQLQPQSLELFIDGSWISLNKVELKWSPWPVIYKLTSPLRVKP